ncbi:tripartite tricarboxylate transporter TctB family protein [Lysinibacillus telephonicus]|uniref:tripartite tricarboxylate transporter TctB family protein n=1 Tax=Lysinibacillus telephonicus TaxID=1714840 RepID=UPI0037D4C5D2
MAQTKIDYITGGIIAIVAVVMFVTTFSFEAFTGADVGVGVEFMPRVISVLLLITSGIIIFAAYLNRGKKLKVIDGETGLEVEDEDPNAKSYKKLSISLGAMLIYAILTQFIGFLLSSILYLLAQMFILSDYDKKKLVKISIIASTISLIVYYIFRNIFYVMLPQGILG